MLTYNGLFFLEVAARASPSSKVLLLSLLTIALWPFSASTPRWAWCPGHISSLTYVAGANPKVGEEDPPWIFICAYSVLVAVSCLVLVSPQDKWAGQSATAFLSAWACLPGSFLCRRYPGGLNVALGCDLNWSLLIKYYSECHKGCLYHRFNSREVKRER